jgi:hypothetical protein
MTSSEEEQHALCLGQTLDRSFTWNTVRCLLTMKPIASVCVDKDDVCRRVCVGTARRACEMGR